jgi:hypothetical protein
MRSSAETLLGVQSYMTDIAMAVSEHAEAGQHFASSGQKIAHIFCKHPQARHCKTGAFKPMPSNDDPETPMPAVDYLAALMRSMQSQQSQLVSCMETEVARPLLELDNDIALAQAELVKLSKLSDRHDKVKVGLCFHCSVIIIMGNICSKL